MAENEELQEEMSEGETRQKILVADDEASIRRILETRLKMVGYDVVTAEDGEEAVEVFNKTNPDLVVLDVMMPKMDGYGVTREIRRTSDVPIIILTALGDVSERITGLELGADDYVIKPFSPRELMARIKAVCERNKKSINNIFKYKGLTVDFDGRDAFIDGEKLNMTPKELDLLIYFIEHKNTALNRDKILSAVWGDYYGDERTVDTHVKMLRKSLGEYRDLIKTVRGMGYKFEI